MLPVGGSSSQTSSVISSPLLLITVRETFRRLLPVGAAENIAHHDQNDTSHILVLRNLASSMQAFGIWFRVQFFNEVVPTAHVSQKDPMMFVATMVPR